MRFVGTPRFACALAAIAITAACSGGDPEVLKRQFVASGDSYAAQQKYNEAIIEYRNAIAQDPRYGEARYKLAFAYIHTNEGADALREAVRAADLLPENADAQLQAANLLMLAGQFDEARGRANKVLARDAGNVAAKIVVGNALAGLKDLKGAIAELEEAIRLDPTRAGTFTNLARVKASAGDLKAAEAAYLEAVSKAPQSVPARLGLVQFYWLTSRLGEAESQLRDVLEANPRDVLVNRLAASFYQTIGRADLAEQHFRTAVDLDGSSRARLLLAEYYISASRPQDAEGVLRPLTADKDKDVATVSQARLATIDYTAGRVDAARRAIDAILTGTPRHFQALLVKASMLFDQGRLDEALARTSDAIQVDPASAQAHFARGRVLAALHRVDDAKQAFNEVLRLNPRAAGAQVELSKLYLQSGGNDTAVTLAGSAARLEPRRPDARLLLARGLINQGQLTLAQQILDDVAKAYPDGAAVHAYLGLLRLAKKDTSGAIAEFNRALELDPEQFEAVNAMSALDLAEGRGPQASARLQTILERSPRSAAILLLAGRTALATGDLPAAEELLQRAISVDATGYDAYSSLGEVYLRQQRIDEARAEFERRAKLEKRPVAALTMVGLIFEMQGRVDDARPVYEQVLAFDPNAPVAANNLAMIYAEHGGNLDVALNLAQTAQGSLPDSADVADTLGWICLKKELVPLAVKAFRRAVELQPENPSFQYHLGLAYAKTGDNPKARIALEKALRLNADFEDAAAARQALASLQG